MMGLLFLVTFVAWLWGSGWIAEKVGNLVNISRRRAAVKVLIFVVLLSLPFVDEIIGKYQFEALCKANGIESADVSKARGKSVKVEYGERTLLGGTIMPIKVDDALFRDASSGEILIQHKNYHALGGWLMRYTWLSMGSPQPMLFGGSTCDIRKEQEIFKVNSITFLYK